MTAKDIIKDIVNKGIHKLFELENFKFNNIAIKKDVILDIIDFAKSLYPKEFLAFLHGTIKNNTLIIDGLQYNEFKSSESQAAPIFHFPDKSFYGSVHSHPSGSNKPSRADSAFFRKTGIVHCIIGRPFNNDSIAFYNHDSEKINIEII